MKNEKDALKSALLGYAVKTVQTLDQLKQVYSFAVPILDLPTGKHTLEFYAAEFAKTPQLLVYAEWASKICGCGLASVEDDHILVGPVAVAEDSRKMGIGSAMLKELEAQAKKIGHTTMILGAREDAERFYLACGFQPHLFVQIPESDSTERLEALNSQYPVVWKSQQDGWSRLMLGTPHIDKVLQRRYEQNCPSCYTQYVFIKRIA